MNEKSNALVLPFAAIGSADLPLVGGKGANLGVLAGAELPVPPGFCVTTAAFDRFIEQDPALDELLTALDELPAQDIAGVRERAGRLREHLIGQPIPAEVSEAVLAAWREAGESHAYAVRSSATLEDLPDASFAGQQDTYLEVRGESAVLSHMRRCWASLFTDRAVLYRRQNGFPSRAARLAVVVQRMVSPQVSGILFTADPLSGHRGVCSIDASYGLGEALVSGLVDADLYRLDKATGAELEVRVGAKARAIRPLPEGGTTMEDVPEADRGRRCLDAEALTALLELALRVESLQGQPQDIEWGIEDGTVWLLQARPITSLFPIPRPLTPVPIEGPRLYLSFGHVQVNTAPMPPATHSTFAQVFPFFRTGPDAVSTFVTSAGGRIYLDVTAPMLRWPLSAVMPKAMMSIDPGIAQRLTIVRDRPAFRKDAERRALPRRSLLALARVTVPRILRRLWWAKPEHAASEYQAVMDEAMGRYTSTIEGAEPGGPRLRAAMTMLGHVFPGALARTHFPVLMAGMLAWKLLGRVMKGRVSEATIQALSRGLPGNVTTEMDLELGDLADLARDVPALAEHLRAAPPATAIASGRALANTESFFERWDRFIARYGHRGPGEVDISLPRWADDPASLVTSIVGMLGSEPGDHRRRHQAAAAEGEAAMAEILEAARGGLGLRRRLVERLVGVTRACLALREHGKFLAMQLFMLARRAMCEAATMATKRAWIEHEDDVWMLTLPELAELFEGADATSMRARIEERRSEYERHRRSVPPRVLTQDGEQPLLPPAPQLEPGQFGGLAASAGTVEGRARVVLDPTTQVLEAGEILVAPFTDPGWTPLFVHAAGLVMEVGGLMTHGSVVAREYGLPAVVGVEGATREIQSGQRIRVDGDRGLVTLLEDPDPSPREPTA